MSTGAERVTGPTPVERSWAGIRRRLAFIGTYVRYNVQMDMEYRTSFLTQVFGMVLNDVLWIVFWWLFFERFERVAGWSLTEIMLLYAVLTTGFGLGLGIFGNAGRLSRIIAEGRLDYYLTLPKPVLLHVLISRSHTSAWGDVLFGFLIFAVSGAASVRSFVMLVVGAILAATVIVSFAVLVHSLAFWFGNAEGLAGQLFEAMMAFSSYPSGLFEGWAKVMLFTLIPAGFISTAPVQLVHTFHWPFFIGFAAFAAGLAFTATRVFYAGLKRYESGNLISLRV